MEVVNPVPVEESDPWLRTFATTLLFSPWGEEFEGWVADMRRSWDAGRVWGVRDRGRWVATLGTLPRAITVPGPCGSYVDVTTDALTAVTVAATHRRRGLLRAMIGQSLAAAVDRGDTLAILVAAEWPIYGRYGYAPAVRSSDYTFHPRRAGAAVSPDPSGAVREVEPAEAGAFAHAVFDRSRHLRAGQVERPPAWWSRRLGLGDYAPGAARNKATWIVHESDDGPDGLLAWKTKQDFELDGALGTVEVVDLTTASDRAYRNLWAYLSGMDVVDEFALSARPIDEPVRWLMHDGRSLRQGFTGDHTWVRILDVPVALSTRGYAMPGQVVLEVSDTDHGGWAAGRYLLDASDHGATCTPTTRSPDLVLPQRALAAAYLGDHSLRALAAAGGVDELTTGALARVDAMFATPLRPWNATPF